MKQAYVHDRLFHFGGAEQLLFDRITRDETVFGRIFVLFSDRKEIEIDGTTYQVTVALPRWINNIFVRGSTSNLPIINKLLDYRNLIVRAPLLCWLLRRKIRAQHPKKIFISSFAAAKNIVPSNKDEAFPDATLYLHSPMQYIRENYDEYRQKLAFWQRWIFIPTAKLLRMWDKKQRNYEKIYANSHYTADCAKRYYNLDATVDYPPLEEIFHKVTPVSEPHDYYLYVGRLVSFVRETDTVIKLFNELELPLLVMGSGPDEVAIKQLAGPSIIFLGHVDDPPEKKKIIKQAKGLINLTKESCGIATMEALACGVPVFGYNEGATPELVSAQQGVLTDSKTLDELITNFKTFQQKEFDRKQIQKIFWEHYEKNHKT